MNYDLNFWLGNISAVIAWILLIYSFWKNKDDKILWIQLIANLFFLLNYIFLKAYTGLFVVFFEMIRDYIYIRGEDDKKIFLFTLPIYTIIGIYSYDGLWSLFSIAASVNDGYSLIFKKKKVVFLGLITYVLWLIYDLKYFSYANAIFEAAIIISNLIILMTGNKEKTLKIKR